MGHFFSISIGKCDVEKQFLLQVKFDSLYSSSMLYGIIIVVLMFALICVSCFVSSYFQLISLYLGFCVNM